MSAPMVFLDHARELDLDYRVLNGLLDRAIADPEVHPRVIARLLQRRAENVQAWGKAWGTRKVEP